MPHAPGIGGFVGQMAASAEPFSLAFTDQKSVSGDGNPQTVTALGAGAESPSRWLLAAVTTYVSSSSASAAVPNSVTIGGIVASKLVEAAAVHSGAVATATSLWAAKVPTGATVDVKGTFPGVVTRMGVALVRVISDLLSPKWTSNRTANTTADITGWVPGAVDLGGFAFGSTSGVIPGDPSTWSGTGVTEVYDALLYRGQWQTGAMLAAGTSPTIGLSCPNDQGMRAVAIAF